MINSDKAITGIREVVLLLFLCSMAVAWSIDHSRLSKRNSYLTQKIDY